jgi:hypothetical protein
VGGRTGYGDSDVAGAPTGQPGSGYDDRGGQVEGTYADTRATAGATGQDTGRDTAPGDRDLVTSSYDPDRDRGYDPQAAGTAMAGSGAAAAGTTHDRGPGEHDLPGGARDARQHDTRDAGDYDSRGYDPATDTGYPGEGRSDADRAVGHRDADYDTGRVDTGARDFADRDLGERDTRAGSFADHDLEGRDTGTRDTGDRGSGHGVGAGVAAAAGGAVAAAGVAAARHRGGRGGDDRGGDDRFSPVDDTATVDPSPTGRATSAGTGGATAGAGAGQDTAADRRAEAVADDSRESEGSEGGRERLVPAERAHDYSSRWDALKGDFVDEPRRAVAQADDLVGELLDEIQRLFADQRRNLEQGFDHDRASTEDLRLALRRYRSFFDRLLSF